MHQLPGRTFRRHEVKPAPRSHSRRKMENAMRDRIAPAEIVEKPAVEFRGSNIGLQFLKLEGHAPRRSSCCLCLVRQERQNVSRLDSANLHAFSAAALAAEDSNSGFRRFQKRSEIFADR